MSSNYLPSDVMTRLHQRFRRLYGKAADRCLRRLEMLVGRYGVGRGAEREFPPLDERSAVLITYADTIRSASMRPLVALRHFVEQRLQDAVSAVHILPFVPYSSDDGFAVINYREVNPDLGTWSHVERLGRRCDLVFDLVLNHVSSRSDWFKEYVNGIAPASRYFHEVDPETDLSAVVRPRSTEILRHTHTSRGERHVWATFSQDQIDLNFANPDVLFEFLDIIFLYISKGMRVVRLDSIAYLWKKLGTPCVHLEETHEVVKLIRDVLELVAPGVLILTETSVPHDENISYFGEGDEAHLVYQFSLPPLILHALHSGSASYLRDWARSVDDPPPGCTFLNFTASHDGIGVRPLEGVLPDREVEFLIEKVRALGGKVSMRRNPDGSESAYELNCTYFDALGDGESRGPPLHVARFLCSQTLVLSIRGVPAVYVHALTATPNAVELAERTGQPRSLNRGIWEEDELNAVLDDEQSVTSRVFREYVRRLEARGRHPAFHPDGRQDVLDLGDALFGVRRTAPDGSETIVAVSNVTAFPQALKLTTELVAGCPFDNVRDVMQADGRAVRNGTVQLEPYGCCWLRPEG